MYICVNKRKYLSVWNDIRCEFQHHPFYESAHTRSAKKLQCKHHWNHVTLLQNTANFARVEDHLYMTTEINCCCKRLINMVRSIKLRGLNHSCGKHFTFFFISDSSENKTATDNVSKKSQINCILRK